MRIVAHPSRPALEWVELRVPDKWIELGDGDVLTLSDENEGWALSLSLRPELYLPGMLPPHLVGMAECSASAAGGRIFGQAFWGRVPWGYENALMDETGARSPAGMVTGTAAAMNEEAFFQFFFILQRKSVVFANYMCDRAIYPGNIDEVKEILRMIEIKQAAQAGPA
jgi:hypothetical protein